MTIQQKTAGIESPAEGALLTKGLARKRVPAREGEDQRQIAPADAIQGAGRAKSPMSGLSDETLGIGLQPVSDWLRYAGAGEFLRSRGVRPLLMADPITSPQVQNENGSESGERPTNGSGA